MTIYDVISELFRFNLDELNYALDLQLEIKFKNEYFIIVDDENKIIFKDKTLNYGFDLENQRRFILNVGSKVFKFFKDDKSVKDSKIEVDESKDIVKIRYRYFVLKKYCSKLDKLNRDNVFYFLNEISSNLDRKKLNIIFDVLSKVLYEKELIIHYVDNKELSLSENILNSVKKLVRNNIMNVYYSNVDTKRADKAVEHIEYLLNKKG